MNRTGGKFPPTQGPSGPGWKRRQALLALRAGNFAELLRSGPRKWGPGKGDYEHEVLIGAGPYPLCPFGTFPPDRGNRPLDKGSRPPGEGLRTAQVCCPYGGCWSPPWERRAESSRPTKGESSIVGVHMGYPTEGREPSLIPWGPVPGRPTGGASPSPTVLKETFRGWVGEPLGAPAGNVPHL